MIKNLSQKTDEPKTPLEIKQARIINAFSRYILHIKMGFQGMQRDLESIEGGNLKVPDFETEISGPVGVKQ